MRLLPDVQPQEGVEIAQEVAPVQHSALFMVDGPEKWREILA